MKSERDLSMSRNAGQIPTSTVHCYWFSGDFPNWLGFHDAPSIQSQYGENGWNALEHALLN